MTSGNPTDPTQDRPVARLVNGQGASEILLVCEHASNHIPARYHGLSLDEAVRQSHVAWDPGAQKLSERLSELLDAPLVLGQVSRLVYDCNRPPEAPDATPARSEIFTIPGNAGIGTVDKAQRVATVYEPFCAAVSDVIRARPVRPVLLTIHSFTPVYFGQPRSTEVGIIHHDDDRLARAMVDASAGMPFAEVVLNQPYSRADGVAHTLDLHGTRNGLVNAMVEVRNDLLVTQDQIDAMAAFLARVVTSALAQLNKPQIPQEAS